MLFRKTRHRISGLVVEYIVAIDVTRVRFPADAFSPCAVQPQILEHLAHSFQETLLIGRGSTMVTAVMQGRLRSSASTSKPQRKEAQPA